MMKNTTFVKLLNSFTLFSVFSAGSLIASVSIGNPIILGFGLSAAGYFAYQASTKYNLLVQHSILQNRAVTLLQKQLTSEE